MNFEIHIGESLDWLKSQKPNNQFVIVTDPPYGIGESNKKALAREKMAKPIDYGDFDWDKKRLTQPYFENMLRISNHQVIFGGIYYTDFLPVSSSWIVWDKQNGTNDFADCEMAWTSHKKAVRIFRYLWNGMIKAKPEQRFHPTQKPLELMRWVIRNYTNPEDIVIDPFAGSGTTLVACVLEGRSCIGVEMQERYKKVIEQRVSDAMSKKGLAAKTVNESMLLESMF